MNSDRRGIHLPAHKGQRGAIRAIRPERPLDNNLHVSFQFLETEHAQFSVADRESSYFLCLVDRLRELCRLSVAEFRQARNKTLRIHRIDFAEDRVALDGFGIKGRDDLDDEAWQFSLSANEHGRVHGFLIENVFFVRWFDANHALYPG
jgi:hypothetical protein